MFIVEVIAVQSLGLSGKEFRAKGFRVEGIGVWIARFWE